MTVAVVMVGIWAAIIVGEVVYAKRRTDAMIPRGVVRRISKPGARHVVRLRGLMAGATGTWNPARPWGSRNWLYGPGEATYWMGEDGLVHLDWRPPRGEVQHLVGPVPEAADPQNPLRRRTRRMVRVVVAAYLLTAMAGFGLAYGLSRGPRGQRLGVGVFGAIAGYFVAYFVMVFAIAHARRRRSAG